MRIHIVFTLASLITLSACNTNDNGNGNQADLLAPACVPHTVKCTDQSIQQLGLFSTVNTATVENTDAGGGVFTTKIDATAGGLSPTKSYVYAKFTATGLQRLDLSDEAAFDSTEWDVAFRRFVIRTNGGISGPGCVTVARTAASTTFDGLTSAPTGLDERTEEYFSDPDATCEYVPDGSGLGSPGVALQSFWSYSSCVAMTDNVFVLTVGGGKKVKFLVQSYYSPTVQETCDTTGQLPSGSSGAGNLVVKWAILP